MSLSHVCTQCGLADGIELILCDGHQRDNTPCKSAFCFQCANVETIPAGDWYCGLCSKRSAGNPSTPTESKRAHVISPLSPDLREKIRIAMQKDTLPAFPGASQGLSSGSDSNNAFTVIVNELQQINSKLSNVVTLDQLNAVKPDMVREFEKTVKHLSDQFAKLDADNKELRKRVDVLEAQLKTVSMSPDPAFKRINFIGFPLANELGRVKFVTKWLADNFDGLSCNVGNISKGPMKNRTLTSIAYAEFSDADMRNTVLKEIQSKSLSCKYNGTAVLIKPCLTQLVRERIWAFNTANDLIKAHQAATGKTVIKRTDSNRAILVNGSIAFDQSGSIGLGTFVGEFADLCLPGRAKQ